MKLAMDKMEREVDSNKRLPPLDNTMMDNTDGLVVFVHLTSLFVCTTTIPLFIYCTTTAQFWTLWLSLDASNLLFDSVQRVILDLLTPSSSTLVPVSVLGDDEYLLNCNYTLRHFLGRFVFA